MSGPVAEEIRPGPDAPLVPCDATASGAEEARVRLARNLRVLDLCAHHFDVHELALVVAGWRIAHDYRSRLA